jgi:hypothetical protein
MSAERLVENRIFDEIAVGDRASNTTRAAAHPANRSAEPPQQQPRILLPA